MASALKAYLADSLRIFALPVTTIRNASERNLGVGPALLILIILTVLAGALRFLISYVPGGVFAPIGLTDLVLQEISTFLFFLISLLVLFALVIVFGGVTNFAKLFATKLTLAAAIAGGFFIALVTKLIVDLLFLGAQDGLGGGLIVLGEKFGGIALFLILAVYMIIVARFGGQLSWLFAVVAGVLHFALMIGIYYAYNVVLIRNDLSAIEQMLQR